MTAGGLKIKMSDTWPRCSEKSTLDIELYFTEVLPV